MGFCPNCGSYVSPGTNVCSCGTTFGYRPESERSEKSEFERLQEEKRKTANSYFRKAKELMGEGMYLEAIEYIDKAYETSGSDYYIFAKAKAYFYGGMYSEALDYFKQSLDYIGIETFAIYLWIGDTLNELYRFGRAIKAYRKAIDCINEDYEHTMNFHREQRWDVPSDEYFASLLSEKNEKISNVKERIHYANRLMREVPKMLERDTEEQKRFLNNIGKDNFITITGTRFHGNPKFEKGMKFTLVKEEDNEFDRDAIAVYLDGVKVGYVANSAGTACNLTCEASDVQICDTAYAEYMFYFIYQYHIARLIK